VAISGNLLAIAAREDQAVTLADISNPATPILRAVLNMGTNGITYKPWCRPSRAIWQSPRHRRQQCGDVARRVESCEPGATGEAGPGHGAFTNLAVPISVALSPSLLAVSEGGNVVTVVEVTNPSAPVWKALLRDGVDGAALFRVPTASHGRKPVGHRR